MDEMEIDGVVLPQTTANAEAGRLAEGDKIAREVFHVNKVSRDAMEGIQYTAASESHAHYTVTTAKANLAVGGVTPLREWSSHNSTPPIGSSFSSHDGQMDCDPLRR